MQELSGDLFANARRTGTTAKLSDVKLLAPVAPSKVIAVGLNYDDLLLQTRHNGAAVALDARAGARGVRHRRACRMTGQSRGVICWNTISQLPPRFSTTHVTRVRTTPPLDGSPGGRKA